MDVCDVQTSIAIYELAVLRAGIPKRLTIFQSKADYGFCLVRMDSRSRLAMQLQQCKTAESLAGRKQPRA